MTGTRSRRPAAIVLGAAVLAFAGVGCGGSGSSTRSAAAVTAEGGAQALTSQARRESSSRPLQNDDYISTYGHEASEPGRRQIARLVSRYYAAALAGHGAEACSLLYPSLASSIGQDYGGTVGLRDASCDTVLPKLFEHLPGLTTVDLASTRVTGVRLRGARGFVQLSSRGMPTGEIAIQREGGSWKLVVPVGRTCRRCGAH